MATRRVLISIDERLLARIDETRQRIGISRSAFLAQLAAASMEPARGPGADPHVHAALAALDQLLGGEPSP